MPFDPSEFAETNQATEQETAVENVIQSLDAPEEPIDDTSYMLEVDKRLDVASKYRLLLNSSLFANGGDAGRTVEREIRNFVRERLEVLLSIKEPSKQEVQSQFSQDEVTALKAVAAKILQKPTVLESPKAKPKASIVQVNTVSEPPKAAIKPVKVPPPEVVPNAEAAAKAPAAEPATAKVAKPKRVPRGQKPFPTVRELEMITAQKAQAQVTEFNTNQILGSNAV